MKKSLLKTLILGGGKIMKTVFFAMIALLACNISPTLRAQNPISGGSLSGIVTDTSGGAVVVSR